MNKNDNQEFSPRLVQIKDGADVLIRQITPEDVELEREFVKGLSTESKRQRFFDGKKELSTEALIRLTKVDGINNMAIIALAGAKEIAVARYARMKDRKDCEFAIVVADKFQRKGLGEKIMEMLIQHAKERDYAAMIGSVNATNHRMIKFCKKLGFKIVPDCEDSTCVKAVKVLA